MKTLKIGMVGLDTSHCVAFTRLLNDATQSHYVAGGQVVAAYPGGTDAFSLSRDRVQGFTQSLQKDFDIHILNSIPELTSRVDAIMLESVDGRQHLEQFVQLAVGKPVYIDKPLTTSYAEAIKLSKIAEETQTPIMSCSSLRYANGITNILTEQKIESCEAFGPAKLLDDYPGLFWYGIHAAEILYSYLGKGCACVQLVESANIDVIVGEWQDGRTGVVRGTRLSSSDFGSVIHTSEGVVYGKANADPPYYALLLEEMMRFFNTGQSPIDIDETLEIIAFLEAADLSRRENGSCIQISDIM
jgi:hypothetical protein